MKRKFLSILLCLSCALSYSQVFPEGDAEWITVYRDYPCPSAFGYHIWKEQLTTDTIIGNYTYQILTFQPLCIIHFQGKICQPYEEYSQASPVSIGGIRQEGEKVFFYKFNVPDILFIDYEFILANFAADTEILLYDFSWSTGDTVRVYTEYGLHRTYLVTDDEIIDGKKNITLKTLFAFSPDITVVEGVGETRGIFGMYYFPTPAHDDLFESCFFQNGELLESHPQCFECGSVSTHDPQAQSPLHLYPNPTSNEIWIDTDDADEPFVLRVHNSTGQLMHIDHQFHGDDLFSFQKLGLKGWMFLTLTAT